MKIELSFWYIVIQIKSLTKVSTKKKGSIAIISSIPLSSTLPLSDETNHIMVNKKIVFKGKRSQLMLIDGTVLKGFVSISDISIDLNL